MRSWGIRDSIVGLTIVAAGTSFPELATSVIASLKRETDIAVGNIVGSNIFNILFIGGAAGTIASPIGRGGITNIDLGFMLAAAVVVLPLMWTRFSIGRREGAILLVGYALYLFLIWPN